MAKPYTYLGKTYQVKRYPPTQHRSLQAWSAAEEYLLHYFNEEISQPGKIGIWHDRFGFLRLLLDEQAPFSVSTYHSQTQAIELNLSGHGYQLDGHRLRKVTDTLSGPIDTGLVRIPKSWDLFELYLSQVHQLLHTEGSCMAGFMTRHFSPQIVKIGQKYFEEVRQSKAWKKARLLLLDNPKSDVPPLQLNRVEWDEQLQLQQYPGVFSAQHIDPATRLLLQHVHLDSEENRILDLGTGNGIIATVLHARYPNRSYHLTDDSYLAIASAKLNLQGAQIHYHAVDSLDEFDDKSLDAVVSNPPFHLEYENNIEVTLRLFKEVHRCLRPGGSFQLVGNRHLNYRSHLQRIFKQVETLKEDDRFGVYRCVR